MDHVPPKQFYPQELRSQKQLNLWVAPTHRECNERYRADEEYFYHSMYTLVAKLNPGMARAIFRDFERRSTKPQTPAMLRRLLSNVTTVTEGGVHLPPGIIRVAVNEYRIEQIVLKIARGLYYLDHGEYIPLENAKDIRCCEQEEEVPELYQLTWRAAPAKTICPEVFSYRHFTFESLHLWSLLFWESFLFCTAFNSANKPSEQDGS